MSREFDVVVVGAGPAGENAADYATQHGLDVAIVERELVGGECSYWGCMPSKAMLRPTEALAAARRVPAAAAAVTGEIDPEQVLRSRDAFTSSWDDAGEVDWLDSVGIELVRGRGRLAGERTVEVLGDDDEVLDRLVARRGVVIAVGSRAAMPPIDGLADAGAWDNRDVTMVTSIPERFAVLGGGVIGVEMAQAFARLGSREVTVIEALDRLVAREEPFAGEQLHEALTAEGIDVRLGARAEAVSRVDGGPVTVTLDDGDRVEADELLVAVGRRAPTDGLGLESIGVEPEREGFIAVDEHLRVADHDWLYVVGDANGRALLTHQGKYQARLVGDALAGVEVDAAWADERAMVRVVFTDPHIAAVGLTEEQAREAGIDVHVVRHALADTAGGALLGKDVIGDAQLVIDRATRTIVGATFVGPSAGELIHAASVAVAGEVTIERLWHAVPAFPTVSEVWLRLLERLRADERDEHED